MREAIPTDNTAAEPLPPPTRRRALATLGWAGTTVLCGAVLGHSLGDAAEAMTRSPDAELLRLGELLDAAWQREKAAWTAWAEADRVDAEDDDPEWLTAAALQHQTSEIVEQIEALPATTLAGALLKVRAISWCRDGEEWTAESIADPMEPSTDIRLLAALLRDLAAIGGQA